MNFPLVRSYMTTDSSRRWKIQVLAASAAFAVCYAPVVAGLVRVWLTSYVYSYGLLVPLISAFLLRNRLHGLKQPIPATGHLWGLPVTIVGAVLLVAGQLAAVVKLQQLSLIVTLSGLIVSLFGREIWRVVRFPVLYLLLMLPIWDYFIGHLQVPSQVLSARIGASFLALTGMPTLQDGTRVILPLVTLDVLRECSGVNQLVSILAMTLAAGDLWLRSPIRRAALLLVAVAIAYLSNGFRIALIGFLAQHGLGDTDIRTHILEGLVVSLAGYLLIYACLRLFARSESVAAGTDSDETAPARSGLQDLRHRRWLGLSLAALACAGVYCLVFRPADIRLREELRHLPTQFEDWTADQSVEALQAFKFTRREYAALETLHTPRLYEGVDDELARAYRNRTGTRILLYIGYHRLQRQGKELVGGDSGALTAAATRLTLDVGRKSIELNEIDGVTAGTRQGLLFWYDLNGRVVADEYLAKGYTCWDALTRRRTNGAVVLIAWDDDAKGTDRRTSRHAAIAFVRALLPILPNYIPS